MSFQSGDLKTITKELVINIYPCNIEEYLDDSDSDSVSEAGDSDAKTNDFPVNTDPCKKEEYSDESDNDSVAESELEDLKPPPYSSQELQNLDVIKKEESSDLENKCNPLKVVAGNLSRLITKDKCFICNKKTKNHISKKRSKHTIKVLVWLDKELSRIKLYNEENVYLLYCVICSLPLQGDESSKRHYEEIEHKQNIPKQCLYCFYPPRDEQDHIYNFYHNKNVIGSKGYRQGVINNLRRMLGVSIVPQKKELPRSPIEIAAELKTLILDDRCLICVKKATRRTSGHYRSVSHYRKVKKWLLKSLNKCQFSREDFSLIYCMHCNLPLEGTMYGSQLHFATREHFENAQTFCDLCCEVVAYGDRKHAYSRRHRINLGNVRGVQLEFVRPQKRAAYEEPPHSPQKKPRLVTETSSTSAKSPIKSENLPSTSQQSTDESSYFNIQTSQIITKMRGQLRNLTTPNCRVCTNSGNSKHTRTREHVISVRSWAEKTHKDEGLSSMPIHIFLKAIYCERCCIIPKEDNLTHYYGQKHKRFSYCPVCVRWVQHANDLESHKKSKDHQAKLRIQNKFVYY
ncbi:hypothetical protein GWI33_006690 [Rhynchophorus ferrugineus]|uniref:U1-type domain-containing protein n=1 Tax=Rhynchophorus ferrugineus TaxID=354439 RepID=A0A834IIQ8_RHYFE|nr:hypothetical protein GWI33_006690 [Rhynchophorus ferrugineus]